MPEPSILEREASTTSLEDLGIVPARSIRRNLATPVLVEEAVRRGEAILVHGGPILARTGEQTGRSPDDKYVVREPSTEGDIGWGPVNVPFDPARFDALLARVAAYLRGKDLFVQDSSACADPEHRLPLRVVTEHAWHGLFARNMFNLEDEEPGDGRPGCTVIAAPGFEAVPGRDGTRSPTFIILHLARRLVLIGGTAYAGEIKKSVFTILNYLLPREGVLPMHAAANLGPAGDVAVFFGLSGTGKTTLSADPRRTLIGDDEHGWTGRGVFNFERGCYAKVIRLSPEGEPEIHATTRRFGTVLENVVCDPRTRRIDLDDASITENTRAAYPIDFIPNASPIGMAGHPRDIVFLTADAFGILPPIARLTPAQARYWFISGYTSKVAGTERGVKEPRATFSACFGAPFLPLLPAVYSRLLGEKIARHGARVWLLNTGWTGGPYGTGRRMPLALTRTMLDAALSGALDAEERFRDPVFGLETPAACPGVPGELLRPRDQWADPRAYDAGARELAARFRENFRRFEAEADPAVRAAGPV
jgi:phosphoenolpyruvate carboxykinase (ATP)